jgi:hypothetical protein
MRYMLARSGINESHILKYGKIGLTGNMLDERQRAKGAANSTRRCSVLNEKLSTEKRHPERRETMRNAG